MRKSAVRAVAVAMAIGAATSTGSALAAASPAGPPADQVSAMATKNPQQAAKQLKTLRAELNNVYSKRDLAGVQQSVRGIDAALGALRHRTNTWRLQDQTVQRVDKAATQNTTLGTKLGAFADSAPQADVPQLPAPSVPPPLDSVSALVQGLLANLQGIVNGLLPVSSPPVAVPAVPVPTP